MGFFDIFKTPLRKVPSLIDSFWSKVAEDDYSQLDPEKLKQYYREEFFVKAITNISTSFVFADGFSIKSEDKEAQDILSKIWNDNLEEIQSAGRDASLFGNAYLFIGYKNGIDIMTVFPGKVSIIPNPADIRDYKEILITHIVSPDLQGISQAKITTRLTSNYIETYKDDRLVEKLENKIKEIPIIHIAYDRFAGELYGTGDITEAIIKAIKAYSDTIEAARKNLKYHGTPTPVIITRDTEAAEKQIKNWDMNKALLLPEDSEAKFLESSRPFGELKDFLEILFYNIVILSETPEFLLGAHTPSSLASVKEQMHPIIRKTKRRQLIWKQAIQDANRIILKLLELNEGYKFSTYETEVEFPEPYKKDLKDVVDSISKLVAAGIINEQQAKAIIEDYLPQLVESEAEDTDYNPENNWQEENA
ncbi:Phage portal protein, SPP1 Gp6-like [Persephonella hydrogeniphila]|uniref:Phage portal protein, SPP1 Gp6-like n=1 Tax=Persephonella hydrogeniphila TaxID=198703 RepID=A0A285NK13_9AQUI|nr:phage portal protein [Persephonella hydrogeniphila]SNZ08216.1 Phage portal protein, SPP1 Gp6-like [Persephonella hydrogeniphila]